jgi:hypothetical protein
MIMTTKNNFTTPQINTASLGKHILAGALIGLTVIGAFLISAGEPNPEWGAYWRIKPLIMVPLAGATGGAIFYFMTNRFPGGVARVIAAIFSVIVFIVGLWLGTVLGLNGTYWD